jgi:hypothetical protein
MRIRSQAKTGAFVMPNHNHLRIRSGVKSGIVSPRDPQSGLPTGQR